jgi:hypothetical protein
LLTSGRSRPKQLLLLGQGDGGDGVWLSVLLPLLVVVEGGEEPRTVQGTASRWNMVQVPLLVAVLRLAVGVVPGEGEVGLLPGLVLGPAVLDDPVVCEGQDAVQQDLRLLVPGAGRPVEAGLPGAGDAAAVLAAAAGGGRQQLLLAGVGGAQAGPPADGAGSG